MSDQPKPGGYIDRAALQRARDANRRMADLVSDLMSARNVGWTQVLAILAQMGITLAMQSEALAEMALIRERWMSRGKGKEDSKGDQSVE